MSNKDNVFLVVKAILVSPKYAYQYIVKFTAKQKGYAV